MSKSLRLSRIMSGIDRSYHPAQIQLVEQYRTNAQRCRDEAKIEYVLERRALLDSESQRWDELANELLIAKYP